MNLSLFVIGLVITLITAAAGYLTHQSPTEILILIFCQAILTVCLELLVAKSKSDKLFGTLAERLQSDSHLLTHMRQIVQYASDTRGLGNAFMNASLDRFLREAEVTIEGMASGTLRINLGPGGRFFRETSAIDACNSKYQGTSMVNLETYWHGAIGRELLEKGRNASRSGKTVERIFIEHRALLPTLVPFIKEHQAAGIQCYVVVFDEVDISLRRDFALLDDGEVAVHLLLDAEREWTEARFFVKKSRAGEREIEELKHVWDNLRLHSQTAEEFLGMAAQPTATPIL